MPTPNHQDQGPAPSLSRGYPGVTRTELVWPGKRTQVERIALPFQAVETVNQSRAHQPALTATVRGEPEVYPERSRREPQAGAPWSNKPVVSLPNLLIWGDNKYVMASLLQGDPSIGLEPLAGKIDLIYIDPPFATGQDFSYRVNVGDEEWVKEASAIEETAYRDTWGRGLESYLQMMYERLVLMRELLSPEGHLLLHLEPRISPVLRLVLDETFGSENFRNEIVVHRPITKNLQRQFELITALPQGHDVILWYSAQSGGRVPNLLVPYEAGSSDGYWHRFWSGADRPTMRYELLGETPSRGQWKWERARALRAVENYERFERGQWTVARRFLARH